MLTEFMITDIIVVAMLFSWERMCNYLVYEMLQKRKVVGRLDK